MSTLLVATHNAGKARELTRLLSNAVREVEIKTFADFPDVPPPKETGRTFLENAMAKALYAAEKTKMLALADDSGLEVEALYGEPGVRSARFAGEDATTEENNAKLVSELRAKNLKVSRARFKTVLVLAEDSLSGARVLAATSGTLEGIVVVEPRGTKGFGYDPLFIANGETRTLAELTDLEKNEMSHRGRAARALAKDLSRLLVASGGSR